MINGRRQQHHQDSDCLDHELHNIGRRQCPHAAEYRVRNGNPAAHQDRGCARNADNHLHDRADGDRAGHEDHQIIGGHHDAARNARRRAVAPAQKLGNREKFQLRDARHEHHAHHDHAEPVHEDQPHAGDAIDIAELDTAHGGGTAQDDCRQGTGIQDRSDRAARDQKILLRLCLALRPDPDNQDADEVSREYQLIRCHHARAPQAAACVSLRASSSP